jgi:hypothetical protein
LRTLAESTDVRKIRGAGKIRGVEDRPNETNSLHRLRGPITTPRRPAATPPATLAAAAPTAAAGYEERKILPRSGTNLHMAIFSKFNTTNFTDDV